MAKNQPDDGIEKKPETQPKPVEGVAAKAAESFPLTLEEFCTRLSLDDKRVEMIGAFHAVELSAGRKKDTEAAYRARYDQFCKQPA